LLCFIQCNAALYVVEVSDVLTFDVTMPTQRLTVVVAFQLDRVVVISGFVHIGIPLEGDLECERFNGVAKVEVLNEPDRLRWQIRHAFMVDVVESCAVD
jgi:hypothetical protein